MKSYLNPSALLTSAKTLRPAAWLFAGILAALPAQAIIHLNPNPALYEVPPQSAPGDTLPWDNVGKMVSISGSTETINGSVVSLRGRYCLTADHVIIGQYVSFDGVNYFTVDTTFPAVKIGTADLKLFKLVENPNLPELTIADFARGGGNTYTPLYIVGWGPGKLASQTSPTIGTTGDVVWQWGNTSVKRWGTNTTLTVANITPYTKYNYTYSSINTRLHSAPALASEAGITAKDSGGGAFLYANGQWYLAGIATKATYRAGENTSTFATNALRDTNDWVYLYNLRSNILAALPEEVEPDVTTFEGWLEVNALSGADAEATADPDGDGMANLSEFAFGTNPTVHEGPRAPALLRKEDGSMVYRYQLSKVAQGITVQVLHSADVINWSPIPGTPSVVEDNSDYAVYEIEVTPTNSAERFYTVNVTLED